MHARPLKLSAVALLLATAAITHADERPTTERSTIIINVSPRTQTIPQGGSVRFTASIQGNFDQFGVFQILMNGLPCMAPGTINISAPPGTIDYTWMPNIQTPAGCAPGTYPVTFSYIIPGQSIQVADQVTVIVAAAACAGDCNADEVVNNADLSIVLGNFGSIVPAGTSGDVNNDSAVNSGDISVVLAAFGSSC